ncbi:hypothetical protein [Occallatibacter riparius]|uniref:Uncharacterized protein n=1 Tax=Occallatibacter riparius TaxID=1002689 RepID=A0A9J7BJ63_9BACT|nr:hypothetical protein [Occallatibacter riparius]UWZ81834.1 hypothetical protein MOP44_14705 [Occallatibacter riparius]
MSAFIELEKRKTSNAHELASLAELKTHMQRRIDTHKRLLRLWSEYPDKAKRVRAALTKAEAVIAYVDGEVELIKEFAPTQDQIHSIDKLLCENLQLSIQLNGAQNELNWAEREERPKSAAAARIRVEQANAAWEKNRKDLCAAYVAAGFAPNGN